MSQNDFVIDNGTGLAVRQDIESAFQALASNNSGSSAPSTTYGLQSFANTTDSMLQLRNAANNAFVNLRKFDGSLPLPDGSNSSPSLFFDDDTNTGIFSAGGDQINVTTDGTARMGVDNSGNLNFAMEASSSYPIQKLKWSNDSSTTNGFYIAQHSDRNGRIWHEQGLDLVFGTNNAESARLDLSKRFFVGTTTTSLGSSGVFGEFCLRGGTEGAGIHMADNDANVHAGFFTSDNSNFFVIRTITNHPMAFRTNNTERMRIDSSGNTFVNCTSDPVSQNAKFAVEHGGDGQSIASFTFNTTHSRPNITIKHQRASSSNTAEMISFLNSSGTQIGRITSTASATAYNTSGSDKTLKKNFESWNENVLALFKVINPQKFNFIQEDDGSKKSKGFVAQDMVASFPEAYLKNDENSKYFFNPSGMVVYLMKAIQELEAEVASLKAA